MARVGQQRYRKQKIYFLIFIFLDSKLEDNRFCAESKQATLDFSLLLISS